MTHNSTDPDRKGHGQTDCADIAQGPDHFFRVIVHGWQSRGQLVPPVTSPACLYHMTFGKVNRFIPSKGAKTFRCAINGFLDAISIMGG